MPTNSIRNRTSDGRWAVSAITVTLLLATIAMRYWGIEAEAADPAKENVVKEGRLWNIADEPFKYRLARKSGKLWTDEMTLVRASFRRFAHPRRARRSNWRASPVAVTAM